MELTRWFAPSHDRPRSVTILGSTGSVGQNTVDLIARDPASYHVEALVAGSSVELLAEQARRLRARLAVVANPERYLALKEALAAYIADDSSHPYWSDAAPQAMLIDEVEAMWAAVEADPTTSITVDLETRTVIYGSKSLGFEIDDYTRWRLMEGLDDIGLTLKQTDSIDSFEENRAEYKPTTLPIRS